MVATALSDQMLRAIWHHTGPMVLILVLAERGAWPARPRRLADGVGVRRSARESDRGRPVRAASLYPATGAGPNPRAASIADAVDARVSGSEPMSANSVAR